MPRVAVIVLGDIGHSPRMQYHCISLANHNINVDFVGYRGSIPHKRVTENNRINIRYLPSSPSVPSTFGLVFKLIWQIFTMLYVLLTRLEKPDVILMQNPPGLPALFVCWLVAKIRRSRLVIDWHNYTWSIFSLRYKRNFFVQLVEWFEFTMGKLADNGFCVTEAMKKDLNKRGIRVVTHYDRPNTMFRPLNDKEKLNFLEKLSAEITEFKDLTFTAMLISSTSWTADEDFDVLLSALKMYDDEPNETLPRLLVVVTGKGPLKDHYVEKTQRLKLTKVKLVTPWLKAEDYPKILACADIGISLHSSSSGLDLPMKIVDMQGCRLPVLALNFKCINELVTDGVNGYTVDDGRQLFERLKLLFDDFPRNSELTRLKTTCANDKSRKTWDETWNSTVWPILNTYFVQ